MTNNLLCVLDESDLRIDAEIQKIEASRNISSEQQSLLLKFKEFGKPELYQPFLIMTAFFAVQQFSGLFVILVYTAQFSIEAGVVMDAFLSTVIIGVIRCATTVLVGFASDKFGRKPMAIVSAVGMFISLVGTIGFLTLPFAMVAEMYPQKSRAIASGITMCLAFLMSFVHVKMFSVVFEYFGNVAVFSFYSVVALAGVLFSIFILPETKGKSLQEIEQYFKNK